MLIKMGFFETIGFFWILAVVIGPILKRIRDELVENLKEGEDGLKEAERKNPDILQDFLQSLEIEEAPPREPLEQSRMPSLPPPPPPRKAKALQKTQKFNFKSSFDEENTGLRAHHLKTNLSKKNSLKGSILSKRFQNENVYQEYERAEDSDLSQIQELIEEETLNKGIVFHAILSKAKAFER